MLTSYLFCEVLIYQTLIPVLQWSNNTLYLNVVANRQGWRACKRFGWCDLSHPAPKWQVIWHGEMASRV
jgi:hypothetical protein